MLNRSILYIVELFLFGIGAPSIGDAATPMAAPDINPIGGAFSTAQTVSIRTAIPGATIRYTTDGSTPGEISGEFYTAPFTVAATTTVKESLTRRNGT